MILLLKFAPSRTMFRAVVFALCGFLCAAHALANTFQIDGITYQTTSDNTCSVTQGCEGEVTVPQEVAHLGQTYTVTEIGDYCWSKFQNIKALTEYTAPDSEVEEPVIELPAFVYDDNGISYFISEDGVCSVIRGVDVAEVTIPQEITYSGKTFTVTEIGNRAFYDYSILTSIELPNTIRSIGERAFSGSRKLQNIEIPDSVSYIGRYAFSGCNHKA